MKKLSDFYKQSIYRMAFKFPYLRYDLCCMSSALRDGDRWLVGRCTSSIVGYLCALYDLGFLSFSEREALVNKVFFLSRLFCK